MIWSEIGEMKGTNGAWFVQNLNTFPCSVGVFGYMNMPVECFNRIGG
jgi:hypothetical protein